MLSANDCNNCEKLKENERLTKRLQDMIDNMPLMCNTFDREHRIIDCNNKTLETYGVDNKKDFLALFHKTLPKHQPDGTLSAEKARACIKRAFEDGSYSFDWMGSTFDGEPLPSYVSLVRFEWRDELYVVAFVQDKRELKKASLLASRLSELEIIAYTDPLTGAYNRRYFMEQADKEFAEAMKDKRPFSIIIIDIDRFKSINDNFGHPIGDEVLKILVARLQNVIKQGTVFARFGGEEFIVMLPGVTNRVAEDVAWRINRVIETQRFQMGNLEISVTVSCGVGTTNDKIVTLADTILIADKALYSAKDSGRNTVVCL